MDLMVRLIFDFLKSLGWDWFFELVLVIRTE